MEGVVCRISFIFRVPKGFRAPSSEAEKLGLKGSIALAHSMALRRYNQLFVLVPVKGSPNS